MNAKTISSRESRRDLPTGQPPELGPRKLTRTRADPFMSARPYVWSTDPAHITDSVPIGFTGPNDRWQLMGSERPTRRAVANKTRIVFHSPSSPRCLLTHAPRLSRSAEPGTATGCRARSGQANGLSTRPLLVIAGAGSGKTSTLAHRVAHLIVNGADPRRILLMTFSRRAAAEMTRRVERIVASATGGAAAGTAGRARLGRHVPCDRRPTAARLRPRDRPRSGLHDP